MAPRTFTEIEVGGTYNFKADSGWSGSDKAEFYIDKNYIYYGPAPGIEKWERKPDGTFGRYLGRLQIPPPNKGETLAYDAKNSVWYTGTSSRAIYSFKVGVDSSWRYEFTYPSYGSGQGYHGGMEFVGGYLFVSERNTDFIGQWKYTGTGPYNGWQEVNRFSYIQSRYVSGLGFGPLGHFWASGGVWKVKQEPPSVYEIGGGPTKLAAGFVWSPEPQKEGHPVDFKDASTFWPDEAVSWHWGFGDGGSASGPNPAHIYGDDGIYPVRLTVTSSNGQQATASNNVSIVNVPPAVAAGPDQTVNEGATVSFVGSFIDPGQLDTHSISWDFGDGSTLSGTLTPTHIYGDSGSYTVTLTVTDDDGGIGSGTLTITVNNVAPSIAPHGPYSGDEGSPIIFSATATDAGSDDLTFTWDWGDGTQATVTSYYNDGAGPDPAPSPLGVYPFSATNTVTHTYGDNGTYTVTLTVRDDDGGVTTQTLTVTVGNVVPVAAAGGPYSGDEGSPITFSATATDAGSDDLTFTWDWGDGTQATVTSYYNDGAGPDPAPSPLGVYPFSATNTVTHTYGDNGTYTVTLTVRDDDGGVETSHVTVTILNVAPTVEAGPDQTADEGEPISLSAGFADPGWLDAHIATIDWGDGNTTAGAVAKSGVAGIVSGSHAYAYKGAYSVTLVLGDDDGGVGKDSLTIYVPLGITVSVQPSEVPSPSNAQHVALRDIPLQGILLKDIPLQDIPLQDISLGASPLQDIPLQDIPLQDINWQELLKGTSLEGLPLQDITLGDLWRAGLPTTTTLGNITLSSIPLQDITLADIFLAGIPLQDIVLGAAPLQDIPLQDIPLQDIGGWQGKLLGTPLQDIPLQDITLRDLVLNGIPLQDIPLQDIAILGTPLQYIPLQDIPLQDTSWQSILLGTPLQDIPLQDITLRDLVLNNIPLRGIPLQDILLARIPLQDIPLQDIPLQDINIIGTPLQDIPLQDIPLQDITWQSILLGTPLQDIPLQDITLGDLVLAVSPLQDITLGDVVLAGVPLNKIPLQDIPIVGTPLQDIPLQRIFVNWTSILAGTVFQGANLATTTLGDIARLGIPLQDITLRDALLALIPLQDIPWEAVPLQNIPVQGLLVGQNGVTYTITVANYGNVSAENVAITHILPEGFGYVAGSTTGATTTDPVKDGQQLTWGTFTVPAGSKLAIEFKAIAATSLGTYFSNVSATSSIEIPPLLETAPVEVIDTFEDNDSWAKAYEVASDRLYLSYIDSETDVDWYKIPVPLAKGSMVTVYLSHLPADYDMVLFAGVKYLPADIQNIPLQDIPLQDIPLQDIPLQDIPLQDIPLQDITLQDIPLQDIPLQDIPLQDIPLQDISMERGVTDEIAADKVVNESGYYYVLVSGYNGAHGNKPYVLRIKITPPPGVEPYRRVLPAPGPWGTPYEPYGADTETLIVANQQRLEQYYGHDLIYGTDGLMSKLRAFANLSQVKGMVLSVDYQAEVRAAYAAWDADAGNPEAANDVATAIRTASKAALISHPQIRYVVMVGSDEIVPFRRVPDEVYLSNESTYASRAHLNPSALYASLAHGYILTDDYYVDMAPVPWMGRELYVPDYAIGRLVETPREIIGVLDQFAESGGMLEVRTALVTGYDFLTDGANAIVDALRAQGLDPAALINDTWTISDIESLLLGSPAYDLNSLNAHFNHWAFGPALGSPVYSNRILASYLGGKLIFSMGCHSGLNVDDSVSHPGDWALDFPQAFAQKEAWFVGNTGYGYGDSDIVALSEELMFKFATALSADSPVPVGQALVKAKQDYFLTMGSYGPFDEKILIEATLYGLPMYQIRVVSPLGLPEEASGTPLEIRANRWVNVGMVDSLTKKAQLVPTAIGVGQFYAADGETQFTPYRPIQPQTSVSISYPGQVAHGVLFNAGTYEDHDNFDPVIARPLDDHAIYEPQIINEAWYPSKLQTVMSLQTPRGALQTLVVTPAQFITTSSAPKVTGTERLYTSLSYDVYYSTSQDYTPPIIELTDLTARGTVAPFTAFFSVKASDANDPGIPDDGRVKRVVVTWAYAAGDTTWESIDLQYDSVRGTWVGELPGLAGGEADFIVQAIDGAGNVGVSASKGYFFTPVPVAAGADNTAHEGDTVSFQGVIGQSLASPSIIWDFGDGSTATGTLNPSHVYRDNGIYTVTLRVSDGKGGSGWDTLTVTVYNVAPAVNVPQQVTAYYTDPLHLAGILTDPGSADTHTYRWDFRAEGTAEPLVTIWANLEVIINWLEWLPDYPAPGNYTATLTVTDDDGGVGTATTLVTIKGRTATVVGASVNPSVLGQAVTFTATVSLNPPRTTLVVSPAGTVTFADGAVALGTAPMSTSDGLTTASFSTFALSVGSHSITATYSGDSYFDGSSSSLSQRVVYKFGGFLEPIPNSNHNRGRTIPVKFTITDFNGVSIGTAVAVVSVNGGPALGAASYDPTKGQYHFNLQTDGLPLGLLTITVSLDDGTTHSVTVQLT